MLSTDVKLDMNGQRRSVRREGRRGGRGRFREVHYVDTRSPSLPRPSERGREGERGSLEKAQSPVLAEILTALVIKALVLENRLCLSAEID